MRYLAFLFLLPLMACAAVSDAQIERLKSPGAGMAQLGEHMRQKGELGGAMDFYRRALTNDPMNLVAIKGLAKALEAWGDREAAANEYARGVRVRPHNAELRKLYGKLLVKLDQPVAAQRQFRAALNINKNDVKARGLLAVALDYEGRHVSARKHYRRAIRQDPENLSLINNMAYSFVLSHRYDMAIALLEPIVDHPESTPALRQNLALAYGLAGMDLDAQRVASMDLGPIKVEEAMDYYRRQRAELAVSNGSYAELGTYATEAMAMAQVRRLQPTVKRTGGKLKAVVLPELSAPGGTPRFAVRMMGCSRPSDVSRLCKTLAKSGIPCVARGKGGE